ncbi:hypothetical protein VPHD148_0264 [Vibrio phage D148]
MISCPIEESIGDNPLNCWDILGILNYSTLEKGYECVKIRI